MELGGRRRRNRKRELGGRRRRNRSTTNEVLR